MSRSQRPPDYETYHGRVKPYSLTRRELFLPNGAHTPSFHSPWHNRMPPEPRQRKPSATTPEEKKDGKSFKKLVLNFTEYTSAHGIGRLGASKSIFFRIFWSIVCMGAFSMFIYQFIGLFQQYLSKPVSTAVAITFEKRLPFPAVTVCNLNMLRKDVMPEEVKKFLKNNLDYSPDEPESGIQERRRRDNPTDNPTHNPTGNPMDNDPTNEQGDELTDTQGDDPTDSQGNGPTHNQDSNPTHNEGNDPAGSQENDNTESPTYSAAEYATDDYYNDDEYADYYNDHNDYESDYYDEDESEEFPDEDELSPEVRLRLEVARLIGGLPENELYYGGHLFEDFIRNCTWKGINCKTGNLSKFWIRHWNYKYGNCYTFNSGKDKDGNTVRVLRATKPGPSQGLLLEVDVEQEQYIGPLALEGGIRVSLNEQGHMPFPYEEGFSVSTGRATSVGLKKTQISRLDRFKNKSCLPQDELPITNIYRRYKNITAYSQQACLNSCLGLSQRIRCKCSEDSFPSDKAPCDVFDEKTSKCLRTVKYLFNNDKLSCLAECRQPCQEQVIQKTISSSQWPSTAYKNYLIAQKKYQNESDNLLQLNVFFNELNYEQIEEKFSYGTINLLADIGGQLGLWIGISAITCCEVLELIIMFLTVCVKKFNDASHVHDVPAWGN